MIECRTDNTVLPIEERSISSCQGSFHRVRKTISVTKLWRNVYKNRGWSVI